MRTRELARLVGRDLLRTRGALATAGFGIVVGTAALFFFLSLGIGVRTQLLSHVFPIDKLELEPQTGADPGLLALVLGDTPPPPGIDQESVNQLRSMPEVRHVFPKLRLAFPTSARGGKELIGQDVGSNEMICDGVEPELVASDVANNWEFLDPWDQPGPACTSDDQCDIPKYCERPSGSQQGKCVEPVPVLVSRYLVEFFNKGIAPTHRLPSVGNALLEQANGVVFTMRLGESLLGTAKMGSVRIIRARIVGVSPRAIDLGLTLPIGTVQRWNSEYAGDEANRAYSSVLVETKGSSHVSAVIERADQLGMVPKDRRARDVSLLIDGVTGLLSLVSTVILVMAGANVAYTFRALTLERHAEIALYRAVGASRRDIFLWQVVLALVVGVVYSLFGLVLGLVGMVGVDWIGIHLVPEFPFKPDSFFVVPLWLVFAVVGFGGGVAVLGAARGRGTTS